MADARRSSRSRSPYRRHALEDVVAERGTAFCSRTRTLIDACDILSTSGRTAVVVGYTDDGKVCGLLTENDILQALVDGESHESSVEEWFQGPHARFAHSMTEALTVSPKATLCEAAEVMAREAIKDSRSSCHHVLVADEDCEPRILSALDIALAMLRGSPETAEAATASMRVKQAMKPRQSVATCRMNCKLSEAYRVMCEAKQNCVLAIDEGKQSVHGLLTVSDALRTFAEHQDGDETTVAKWLSCLTTDEHPSVTKRSIYADATLATAAKVMSRTGVHHLAVLTREEDDVIGILSALDVVRALNSNDTLPHRT